MNQRSIIILLASIILPACAIAQTTLAIHDSAAALVNKPDTWFSTDPGIKAIDGIVAGELPAGGWAKGYDNPAHNPGKPWEGRGTIDNDFTYTELKLLARACNLTHRESVLEGFNRGVDFLFKAQYPNGGWPQRFPFTDDYGKDITFNDDAMMNVMHLMRDVAAPTDAYAFVDAERRAKAKRAFDLGLECILKCQVVVNGTPTAWAQQYDPQTLVPSKARAYELPCLTANESSSITLMLMSLDDPSPQVQRAVRSAVAWFERSKVMGIRTERKPDPSLPKGYDVVAVDDPSAGPLWGRMYDIETNKPFFCGRDGVKKWSMNEIEAERRSGYAWYGTHPKAVLEAFAAWDAKQPNPGSKSSLIVAPDGSAPFKTVQSAIDSVPENNSSRVVIHVKPGTYKQRLTVPANKPFLTFEGEDAETTILTFNLAASDPGPDGKPLGTFNSYSTMIAGHDFVAQNITFENSSGDHGQALAMAATGDRLVVRKCRFLGWQDTLYANGGRQYYSDCYIAGRVDFIFGNATAVFDGCEIHSRNGGHVTAASTAQDQPFGYVFLNCKLTGDAIPWTSPAATQPAKITPQADLGRPWRPYGAVAYLNCEMGDHIKPEGWNNWRSAENEKTARFSEYQTKGPGANADKRFAWAKQLADEQAAQYTVKNVLGGKDDWNPASTD